MEANMRIINFLDVTLDLNNDTYSPYTKPNHKPLYVNAKSNHPPPILKNIPEGVQNWLSNLSSNEDIFNKAKVQYEHFLRDSGYNVTLCYNPDPNFGKPKIRNKCHRKVLWFNPPFDGGVKTNIGKVFLKIVSECFPKTHKLHKILNRNSVKVSYCTMANVQ